MMNTLTTDHESLVDSTENLTNASMNADSNGKVKAVVSKLVRNWRQLNASECNVKLFQKLISNGISTRDIHSFVMKQADLRKIHKGLDKPMSVAAMRSKLKDACAFSVRQRRSVNKLKKELLQVIGNKRFKHKRIVREIREKLRRKTKSFFSLSLRSR